MASEAQRGSLRREELLSRRELAGRGWTDAAIRRRLGDPDATRPNPIYSTAAPMRFWVLDRVEAVEATEAWRQWLQGSARRRQAVLAAAAHRRERWLAEQRRQAQELLAQVETMRVQIPELPLDRVRRRAIANYNERLSDTDAWTPTPASEVSDPAFLDRISVSYLRHASDYEQQLDRIEGRPGHLEAYTRLKCRFLDEIARLYPELAAECRRQARQARDELDLLTTSTQGDGAGNGRQRCHP